MKLERVNAGDESYKASLKKRSLMIIGIMALSFIGCGNRNEEDSDWQELSERKEFSHGCGAGRRNGFIR